MEKSENKNRKGEVHLGKSEKLGWCLRSQAGALERGGNAGRADVASTWTRRPGMPGLDASLNSRWGGGAVRKDSEQWRVRRSLCSKDP